MVDAGPTPRDSPRIGPTPTPVSDAHSSSAVIHPADVDLVRKALRSPPPPEALRAREDLERRLGCVPRILRARNEQLGRPLSSSDIPDLVQDTLTVIWRKLPQYEGRASLETWIYRICSLELMNAARRVQRRAAVTRSQEEVGALETVPDEAQRAPSHLVYEELYHHLSKLPADLEHVLRLKHYEDKTFEEIGAALGLKPSGAKHHYYRALELLRERMSSAEEASLS